MKIPDSLLGLIEPIIFKNPWNARPNFCHTRRQRDENATTGYDMVNAHMLKHSRRWSRKWQLVAITT